APEEIAEQRENASMAASSTGLHYGNDGIAERLLTALRTAHGKDAPITPETLAPLDHFHGRGVAATEELVALLKPQAGERILDIGSGIGGPARWIAAKFGCHVTGVDLTPEFCATADALNEATGMADRVTIMQGSAIDLPLPDASFDRAYSQNVVMNIADKPRFCREAFRVLRTGGVLALSNLCAGPAGEPYFPVPWSSTPATSFLATPEQTRADLLQAGFEIVEFRDTTDESLPAIIRTRERIESGGLPPLGVHLIMGARFREMQINSSRTVEDGRGRLVEALVKKPG
ncbi:MAG TPA: class I SAM-dependent methyltransferase, partial [Stellaceae bacterium]|nr:class I SAM-dependent methyltransferase [Stellaceae bacterium]